VKWWAKAQRYLLRNIPITFSGLAFCLDLNLSPLIQAQPKHDLPIPGTLTFTGRYLLFVTPFILFCKEMK